jgi:hypothetical protein
MDSTHHERPASVTERLQVSEDPVRAAAAQARDVLSDGPARAALADEAGHLVPQAGARAREPGARSGQARVLAREAAADEVGPDAVDAQAGGAERTDVRIDRHARPVPGKHTATERIGLAKCSGPKSCPVKAEAEAADAAEQIKDNKLRCHSHLVYFPSSLVKADRLCWDAGEGGCVCRN